MVILKAIFSSLEIHKFSQYINTIKLLFKTFYNVHFHSSLYVNIVIFFIAPDSYETINSLLMT